MLEKIFTCLRNTLTQFDIILFTQIEQYNCIDLSLDFIFFLIDLDILYLVCYANLASVICLWSVVIYYKDEIKEGCEKKISGTYIKYF